MKELHQKYRPKKLSQVVGQSDAVELIQEWEGTEKIPRAILLVGPTGCGKTTIGRILAKLVNCSKYDFTELNTADFRGIENVREILSTAQLKPLKGPSRFWLIDEAHQLTSPAQHAFLKLVEEPPENVYFCFATTEPHKLLKTIRDRCSPVKLKLLTNKEIKKLIRRVCKSEKSKISNDVLEKIIEYSEGIPRKALIFLNSIIDIKDEDKQLNAIENPEFAAQALQLGAQLMKPKPSWKKIVSLLESLEEDEETLRLMVLGYARKVLMGGGKMMGRAYLVIDAFSEPFFYSHKAGLLAACYEVIYGEN